MNKTKRSKLRLSLEQIRALGTTDLAHARGGGSEIQTCSHCVGVAGCDTGDRCPQQLTGSPTCDPWPDPPPR